MDSEKRGPPSGLQALYIVQPASPPQYSPSAAQSITPHSQIFLGQQQYPSHVTSFQDLAQEKAQQELAKQSQQGWARDASRVAARNAFIRQDSKRTSILKRKKSEKKQKAFPKTLRPVLKAGIKVDTSVSRHRGAAPTQLFPGQNDHNSSLSAQNLRLNSTQGNGKRMSTEGLFIHISPSDNITPSDRAILIGLAVPQIQHLQRQRSDSDGAATPTILITPAREGTEWDPNSLPEARHKPRIASSIYSRPTTFFGMYQEDDDAPPVPALPNSFQSNKGNGQQQVEMVPLPATNRESTMTAFEEDDNTKQRGRSGSSATVFEEDGRFSFSRMLSRKPNDLSIETGLPTPRRSHGWWNVIMTPFANSPLGRSPVSGSDDAPPVPVLSQAAPISGTQHIQGNEPKDFGGSPQSSCSEFSEQSLPEDYYSKYQLNSNILPTIAESRPSTGYEHRSEITTRSANDQSSSHLQKPYRASEYSLFSPNDREVPIMLDSDVESMAPSPRPFEQTPRPIHGAEKQIAPQPPSAAAQQQPSKADYFSSPMSSEGTFSAISPGVVEYAAIAPVVSARQIGETPAPAPEAAKGLFPPPKASEPYFPPPPTAPFQTVSTRPSSERRTSGSIIGLRRTEPEPTLPYHTRHIVDINLNDNRQLYEESRRGTIRPKPESTLFYDKKSKKPENRWVTLFSCFERNKLKKPKKEQTIQEKKKRRRICCCWCCLIFAVLTMIAIAVALGVTLSHKHHHTAGSPSATPSNPTPGSTGDFTGTQWVNITNYPPMPTGVLTVARPDLRYSQSGCITPATLWSCAVPKEMQASIAPNNPDQPNFRLEVLYNNSTKSSIISDPSPPSVDEQKFLGNTTDANATPFEGETTPFYISFLPTTSNNNPTKVKKRAATVTSSLTGSFPDIVSLIPAPDVETDGTAAPANLLPFPTAEPVRIYNRGRPDEHYGFYTYFDRSIFLKNHALVNESASDINTEIPADEDGGSTLDSAVVRCTWAQTRFLVQIWTNMHNGTTLLSAPAGSSTATSSAVSASATDTSSTTFIRPGTFPYPVSITLDRHGGDVSKKMLYCYGMDQAGHILVDEKKFSLENKKFGGTLINPTLGPFQNVTVSPKLGGPGGIDGGTGGCGCRWENFNRS